MTGSGCIAALEAEKFLAEHDEGVLNYLEANLDAKKSDVNGNLPEYRANPLL